MKHTLLAACLALATSAAAAEVPPPPSLRQEDASCLRRCAGLPKEARGEKLLACLSQCERPAASHQPDAGGPDVR